MQIEKGAGLPEDGVMVCGDSGNDVELFAVAGVRGCMVSNAHPELRKYCDEHASDNIFQACTPPSSQRACLPRLGASEKMYVRLQTS